MYLVHEGRKGRSPRRALNLADALNQNVVFIPE